MNYGLSISLQAVAVFFRVPLALPQRIKLKALFTCRPLMNLVFRLAAELLLFNTITHGFGEMARCSRGSYKGTLTILKVISFC